MTDQPAIIYALKKAYREARIFQLAADCCAVNFEWLRLNRVRGVQVRPIYLLDFDMIASAVRTLSAVKLARMEERRDPGKGAIPFAFHELLGPYTMDLICRNLRSFSLPLGTKKELLNCKHRIESSASSSVITSLVGGAGLSGEQIERIFREVPPDSVATTLKRELEALLLARDDIALLEYLLTNETCVDTLVSEPLNEGGTVLGDAFKRLQKARPGRTENNLCDALNLLALVWITEKPAGACPIPIPFLISQTEEVAKLGKLANRWIDRGDDLAQLNDPPYLVLATQLSMRAEEDEDFIVSHAQLLTRQARTVAETDLMALRAIEAKKIAPDEFDAPEWRLVQLRMDAFRKQLGESLPGLVEAVTFDRVSHQNLLFSKRLDPIWTSFERDKQLEKGVRRLRDVLTQTAASDKILRSLVFERSDCRQELKDNCDWLFQFSYLPQSEAAGCPLAQAPQGVAFELTRPPALPLESPLRICAHDRLGALPGAAFAVDMQPSREADRKRYISVVWRHGSEAALTWTEGVRFLHAHAIAMGHHDGYEAKLFSQGEVLLKHFEFGMQSPIPDEIRAVVHLVEYFELRFLDVTFFADVSPIQKAEMQCGCVFPRDAVTVTFSAALARALHSTLEVGIPVSHLAKVLCRVLELV